MTSRDFCFWLQGFFELRAAGNSTGGIDEKQVDMFKKHLALVFKHEIDPAMGDSEHQEALNQLHDAIDTTIYRC